MCKQRIRQTAFDTRDRDDIAAGQITAHRYRAAAHSDLGFSGSQGLYGRDAAFDQDNVNVEAMLFEDFRIFRHPVCRHIGGQGAVRGLEADELRVAGAGQDMTHQQARDQTNRSDLSNRSYLHNISLAQQKFRQYAVELFGLFDLRLVGRVHKAMYSGPGDDLLKIDVPVPLI